MSQMGSVQPGRVRTGWAGRGNAWVRDTGTTIWPGRSAGRGRSRRRQRGALRAIGSPATSVGRERGSRRLSVAFVPCAWREGDETSGLGQIRLGWTRPDVVRLGSARQDASWFGTARFVKVCMGSAGLGDAGIGLAQQGMDRLRKARRGRGRERWRQIGKERKGGAGLDEVRRVGARCRTGRTWQV